MLSQTLLRGRGSQSVALNVICKRGACQRIVGSSFPDQFQPSQRSVRTIYATSPTRFYQSSDDSSTDESLLKSPEEILNRCAELYDSLTVLNEKLGGTVIPPSSDRATQLPFCLLVGNHSSGKSSFINYIMGTSIQKAGVAPTDDSFTVIAPPGSAMPQEGDADGPTLVGNPDLGFQVSAYHTCMQIKLNLEKIMSYLFPVPL